MEPVKPGATVVEPPPTNNGAKPGDSPSPDALKEAQAATERYRKELDVTKETLATKTKEWDALNEKVRLTDAEKAKKARLEKGIEKDEDLVEALEVQASQGDRDAKALLAAIDARAKKIAKDSIAETLTSRELESSFTKQEDFLAVKAKENKMSVEDLREAIDQYAAGHGSKPPHLQAEIAYGAWNRNRQLDDREAKIIEREKKSGLYRDPGSEGPAPTAPSDGKGSWRDAKTPQERRAALNDI